MKTFIITLSGCNLEDLETLANSRVYRGLTEEQIVTNVLMCAMHDEAKLYNKLDDLLGRRKGVQS